MNYKDKYSALLKNYYFYKIILMFYVIIVFSTVSEEALTFSLSFSACILIIYDLWKSFKGLKEIYFPKEGFSYGR
jgi:uncharacterized membrane protein